MADSSTAGGSEELDLSSIPLDQLVNIHSQVLRQIATHAKLSLDPSALAAGHDSHGSNHSNNKITDRTLQEQLARFERPQG
jgi:hypothetical protein